MTSVTVEAWGGGGAGGGVTNNDAEGAGGAGGQYARSVVTVTPGASYAIGVGAGGTASTGNGGAGGDSTFASTTVVAKGGAGGGANNGPAGVGSTTNGVGTFVYRGGNGSASPSDGNSGAGGGGAGSTGAGGNASGTTAGTGTTVGGGNGGAGRTNSGDGNAGSVYGGGGGGGRTSNNDNYDGGAGAAGRVLLTYEATSLTFTASGSWIAPPGVTSVTVEVWGGGGKGGSRTSNYTGGGGGGGAYSRLNNYAVTPGNSYSFVVGAGATTTSAGGDSSFVDPSTLLAKGGLSVANNTVNGAVGGAAGSGVGDVKWSGGRGADANDTSGTTYGGGGGSSAGTAANGNYTSSTTTATGATAPTGGGGGGNGYSGGSSTGDGTAGSAPGGGGGGAKRYNSGTGNGGAGAGGKVVITYVDTTAPTVSSIAPTTTPTNAASMTFLVTFSESVTGVAAGNFSLTTTGVTGTSIGTISGSGNTRTVTVNTGTGDGTIRLDLSSTTPAITDAAGNNLTATFNTGTVLTVDKTAPTITITEPNTLPAQSKTITASASDGTLTMSNTTGATCDGTLTFIAYASQTFTSEADNGTRVCYRAVDTAGNTAYSLSNAIAGIDTTAPTITITEPDTLPAPSKTITASASDGTLSMSNTTGAICDGTLTFIAYASQTFTSEADNGTRVCYRAVDALGNTRYSLSNAIAGIDTTAPTITITEPDTLPATSKTITASASDGTLSMSNTTGAICDGTLTFVAYASQTFTSEADNGTRVCYRAIDTAGNTSYSLSSAIAGIDTTAPTITITEPDTLPATSKTITASASDGTLSMSNTTGAICDGTLTFVAYASQTFTSEADNGTRRLLPCHRHGGQHILQPVQCDCRHRHHRADDHHHRTGHAPGDEQDHHRQRLGWHLVHEQHHRCDLRWHADLRRLRQPDLHERS